VEAVPAGQCPCVKETFTLRCQVIKVFFKVSGDLLGRARRLQFLCSVASRLSVQQKLVEHVWSCCHGVYVLATCSLPRFREEVLSSIQLIPLSILLSSEWGDVRYFLLSLSLALSRFLERGAET